MPDSIHLLHGLSVSATYGLSESSWRGMECLLVLLLKRIGILCCWWTAFKLTGINYDVHRRTCHLNGVGHFILIPHFEHTYLHSSLCLVMCLFRRRSSQNSFLYSVQICFFGLVCTLTWQFRSWGHL